MSTKPNQTLTFNYKNAIPFNLDDVVYLVEKVENGSRTFYQKCRVCGGTRELTINGVSFCCPCCHAEEKAITIYKYVVRRYRVHKVEIEKSTDTWKPSEYQTVTFYIYTKNDRGHWYSATRRMPSWINPTDPLCSNDCAYTDYKLALAAADAYNERERARLAEYNNLHGTQYEMPDFTNFENDKKSN